MGDATSAHVEAGPVIWMGIQAVRFSVAEAGSWSVGGSSGGGGSGSGACTGFGCSGRGKWGQL